MLENFLWFIAGGLVFSAVVPFLFGTRHKTITQAEYDALPEKDGGTYYAILENAPESRWRIARRRIVRIWRWS